MERKLATDSIALDFPAVLLPVSALFVFFVFFVVQSLDPGLDLQATRILMNRFTQWLVFGALLANLAASPPVAAQGPGAPLPGDSVYQLDLALTDQEARTGKLADLRGRPVLIAMFYTSCKYVCPLIIESLRRVDQALPAGERARLRVVLVSFDPEHDTPRVLRATADERKVDTARWTLARTDADGVQKLAAVLGVQYRAIQNGDFNHSTVISLLDADGRIVAHSGRTDALDADLVAAARRELAAAPGTRP
jgi:protein SCO1/2